VHDVHGDRPNKRLEDATDVLAYLVSRDLDASHELIYAAAAAAGTVTAVTSMEDRLANEQRPASIKPWREQRAQELLNQSNPRSWLLALNQKATR
jgi:hypothetical protein